MTNDYIPAPRATPEVVAATLAKHPFEFQLVNAPVECAWCLRERNILASAGSHGICKVHSEEVLRSEMGRGLGL